MPDENKIVIELELQVKKLQSDLKTAQKDITKFSKDTTKGSQDILKVLKEMKDDLKIVAKAYKEIDAAATRAGKAQTDSARRATQEQKKLNDELKKTQSLTGGGKGGAGGGAGGGGGPGGPTRGQRAWQFMRHPFGGGPQGGGMGIVGRTAMGLGSGLMGFAMGGMQKAYGTYMQYGAARYGMTGLGTPRQLAQMRRTGRAGVSLGFSPTETAQMAPGVAAATGNLGATGVAQQLSLAGGFGPGRAGEAIAYMGTMRQAGQQFSGVGNLQARQKDLSKTIALGMESGLEKARLPEFFAGVGQLVRSQFATAAGKVDANVIAKQLAQLGAGGAGFQGARGAQVMGQLDAMIRRPGGGEAGQAMVLQAMGFGKPGGTTNYYDALKRQQKGVRDPENIKRVMEEVYRQRGAVEAGGADPRNREANLQFATLSGLSLEQVEQLKDIHVSNMTNAEKSKKIEELMKNAEPIDKQALRVSKEGFAGIKKHLAGVEAMQIQIGSRAAPAMMKLQQFQLQVLDKMSKYLPQIIEWLKKIFHLIMQAVAFFKGGDINKNLIEMSKEFDKRTRVVEKMKIGSVMDLERREQELAGSYRVEQAKKAYEIAKGTGVLQYAFAGKDVKANIKRAQTHYAPQIEEHERRQEMAFQFNQAILKGGMLGYGVEKDPAILAKMQAAMRASGGGTKRAELYNEALAMAREKVAKKKAQIGLEAEQVRAMHMAPEQMLKEQKPVKVEVKSSPGADARDGKMTAQARKSGATERAQ